MKDVARSIHQRLVNHAHAAGEETQSVLMRYVIERLLFRLGVSPHRDRFVLKGAMLLRVWGADLHRPTTDLDLLGFGPSDIPHLITAFQEIVQQPVEEDGLTFDPAAVRGEMIREDQAYEGVRLHLRAMLGAARIPVHVDVGFGDPVTPAPEETEYPTILDLSHPRLRVYPPETVVAEKFQALVALGMANSRMKDFYDLWALARERAFDGEPLRQAIQATFTARRTPLPQETPAGLTESFAQEPMKQTAWTAFLRRNRLDAGGCALTEVVTDVRAFLMPPVLAAHRGDPFRSAWPAGGPWSPRMSPVHPAEDLEGESG